MKQETHIPPLDARETLLHRAYGGLSPLKRELRTLGEALDHLQVAGGDTHAGQIRALRHDLRGFEPAVTLIGQVKAGKTSLTNALAGGDGLLPSDINPWTSVVTSLHLAPGLTEANQRAQFRFFTEEEWSSLLNTGGRVGELASRAGADQELEKVRRQLDEMRAASRKRLGDRFEMLLGQTHDYRYVDAELVQRYVCLGDEVDEATGTEQSQGRFADITKSADLYVSKPALPLPICLRDTPGVNDTFMVREQITVKAIRGSRICVVVLSAHQALSNVDLALIRLIANVPSRDVIIFVNRVDELQDPAREIPEIRKSIEATLKAQNVTTGAEIIFGSAKWANSALSGDLAEMGKDSADALLNWARAEATDGVLDKDPRAMVWTLSGLPALGRAMADRIIEGDGADTLARIASGARNIASAISASRAVSELRIVEGQAKPVDATALSQGIEAVAAEVTTRLQSELETLVAGLDTRLEKARETFTARATSALIQHLETYGEDIEWTYDPAGLRLLLKSGYNVFCAKSLKTGEDIYLRASNALKHLFRESYGLTDVGFDLEPPSVPAPPVPVMIGQTIALDIKGSWWSRWWRRRRSYAAYADEFRALIDAEVAPMVAALRADHAELHRAAMEDVLKRFIAEQRDVFLGLANQSQGDLERLRKDQIEAASARADTLTAAEALLAEFARPEQQRTSR